MELYEVLLFLGAVFVISYVIEKLLIKRFNIKRRTKFIYKHVNKLHKRIEITAIILFFVSGFFVIDSYPTVYPYWIPGFFILTYSIRSYMEWKFQRETREFILSIMALITMVVLFPFVYLLMS
ncbi:DUF4181 domain-containing protein [Cytobacillus sp. FJAT-54145]|uniref:DUF4181 domain-containing protein n=1 Tax=Cytobacillus spartinae TaxID=3299023 RepID=A0ABW6K9G1_9BACI